MSLPPAIQEFAVSAAAYLAGIDEMIAATDRLAAGIDAAVASSARMSAAMSSAGAGVTAAADEAAAAADRNAEAQAAMSDAEKAAAGAATFEAELLADLAASEKLLADSAKVVTDALAVEAKALKTVADSAAAAGDAVAVAGDKSEVTAGKMDAAKGSAAGFGSVMKTALLGVGIAMVYSIAKAAEYQSTMTRLLTQAGVAPSQFKALTSGVLQLAGAVGFSPTSLGEALYHIESSFASVGITGPKALSLLKIAAEGAAVGHANLTDVTNALDATIASGVPGITSYSQAMGVLNAIVGAGDMTMQDLADAMGTGLMAVAKTYGQSIYQVGAAMATFGDNNIRGAVAATDLRMTWQAIQAPLKTSVPLLASIGLQYTTLATTMKQHGLSAGIGEFIAHMRASKVPVADWGQYVTEIFGKKAGVGIGVLISQYSRLQSKFPDLSKGADGFGTAWGKTQATMAQQWASLKSGADALAVSFGTILLPAATKIVGALAKFAQALEQHPVLAAFAGALLALAAGFKIAATMEGLFTAATEIDPVFLILTAVIALAAGLYELYRHFKIVRDIVADVGKFFAGAWRLSMEAAGAVIKWFVSGPLAFIKQQIKVFSDWWKQNGAEVRQVASEAWHAVSAVITTAWRLIWDGEIRPGLAILKAAWTLAWGLIRDTARLVWDTIAAVTRVQIRVILDVISVVLDLLTGKWGKAWSDLKKLASDALHGAISIITTITSGFGRLLWDAGVNLIKGLIGGIKSMAGAAGNVVGDIGHGVASAFKLATGIGSPSKVFYALGGNITTGLALGLRETASQVYAEAQALAQKVTAAFGAGQITGSEESSLLARISSDLSARNLSLAKIAASIDYAKLGADITARIGAGITETMPQAQAAARKLMAAIKAELDRGQISTADAERLTLKISEDLNSRREKLVKTMTEIGLKMKAGMLASLENASSASQAKAAVNKLITYVRQAWAAGDITASKASAMTKWLEADSTRLQALAAKRQTLLATIKAADAYAATTTSNTESWAGLSSVASATTSGGMTYSGTLLAGMQANLASIRQFGAAVKKLGKLGLRRDLINQIIQMGPDQGLQVAQALIDGPASVIRQMDVTQAAIIAGSNRLGQAAANAVYDTGKAAGKGFLSGLQAQEHHITAMMDRAAVSMVKTMRRELGMGGHGGGGGMIGNVTVNVPGGFVGTKAELAREIHDELQALILQYNRRNGKNGLSLSI